MAPAPFVDGIVLGRPVLFAPGRMHAAVPGFVAREVIAGAAALARVMAPDHDAIGAIAVRQNADVRTLMHGCHARRRELLAVRDGKLGAVMNVERPVGVMMVQCLAGLFLVVVHLDADGGAILIVVRRGHLAVDPVFPAVFGSLACLGGRDSGRQQDAESQDGVTTGSVHRTVPLVLDPK